jgi:hypothetical protein
MKCSFCNDADAAENMSVVMFWLDDGEHVPNPLPIPKLDGRPVCVRCAHNASHLEPLGIASLPCPVMDIKGNVIREKRISETALGNRKA